MRATTGSGAPRGEAARKPEALEAALAATLPLLALRVPALPASLGAAGGGSGMLWMAGGWGGGQANEE